MRDGIEVESERDGIEVESKRGGEMVSGGEIVSGW